jgi:hypothetical protein
VTLQTSITVPWAVVESHRPPEELVEAARNRLIALGIATPEQLAEHPSMTATPQQDEVDEAPRWAHVTFTWQDD